jgi:hypothetical protein
VTLVWDHCNESYVCLLPVRCKCIYTCIYQTKLSLLQDQPSVRLEVKPLTQDYGYDNVLLGQSYVAHLMGQ